MQNYNDVILDQNGNIVPTASITITDTSDVAVVVYGNNIGSVKTQPFTPNQLGEYFFYAPDGRYNIHVAFNNQTYTIFDVQLFDSIALNLKANIASPTFTGTVGGITAAMVGLGNVNNTSDANKPVSIAQQTALDLKQNLSDKDSTGGYVGLNLFKINFKNVLNTFTSYLTNSNTASRTYTYPDKDGTVAMTSDLTSSTAQTISVTMAANAVTIAALNSMPLEFRSATATSGATSTVTTPSTSLVIPSGATLGSINAIQATYLIVEMDNAGVREFAVSNQSGGLQCDETNLITTTAISAAATSASVWYSTTARTSLPYRLIGTFTATEATAGTWATAASAVQSVFGNALTAMSSLGYGQTWQASGKSLGTTYYNTTGKPIQSIITFNQAATATLTITINGFVVASPSANSANNGFQASISFTVPIGQSYLAAAGVTLISWTELR